ncbi:MAG: hypothetical protein IPK97_19710 [Ahniella sp.]|nr:hypothetical protein [Ahniella sp.]
MTPAGIPAPTEQNADETNLHPVARFFRSLGDALTAELGNCRDTVYARLESVATDMLAKWNPSAQVTPDQIIDYVLTASALCKQADLDGRFAEPPVSLYAGEHFDISALFWLDGTTSIHQHGFCGAFHVLSGSSIHSQYRFERHEVNAESESGSPLHADDAMCPAIAETQPRAIEGTLHLVGCEVLHAGSTRTIRRGQGFIHALFHMVRPSVTIVVRTITDDPKQNVQYDYRWPGFGFDPFHRHAPTIRTQQFLKMLQKLDMTGYQARLLEVLRVPI